MFEHEGELMVLIFGWIWLIYSFRLHHPFR